MNKIKLIILSCYLNRPAPRPREHSSMPIGLKKKKEWVSERKPSKIFIGHPNQSFHFVFVVATFFLFLRFINTLIVLKFWFWILHVYRTQPRRTNKEKSIWCVLFFSHSHLSLSHFILIFSFCLFVSFFFLLDLRNVFLTHFFPFSRHTWTFPFLNASNEKPSSSEKQDFWNLRSTKRQIKREKMNESKVE